MTKEIIGENKLLKLKLKIEDLEHTVDDLRYLNRVLKSKLKEPTSLYPMYIPKTIKLGTVIIAKKPNL